MTDNAEVPQVPEVPNEDGIFTARFWKRATERAIKTMTQALILVVLGTQTQLINDADPEVYFWAGLTGFALSIGYSIVSSPFGNTDSDSPSLVK